MESETTTPRTTSWSSSTNWTVSGGSLVNSVAFESNISPIDYNEAEAEATADSTTTSKSPLILRPTSPDSGPCEIKIGFTQKHEVRQVYVRSTARVYEIYYDSGLQSGNEYLCLAEEVKNISNSTSSEDDWVEVKAPDTPVVENKNFSLPSRTDSNAGISKQELYEATAEITDASPCISLTLRLLSLQSKGCVYVDEVYVFADPVDSADSEDQEGRVENSAGSSLMTMLVPTLLQLSKTTKHGAAQVQNPPQVPVSENKPDYTSYSRLESCMDQLVSRVGRIEDLCLRFEENMLKPISSIEARLQRVEQQLELLAKKSHNSELPSCSRIVAPEFSCNGSDSNSFYNSGSDYPNCGSFELDKKVFHSDVTSIPPDDTSDPVNATQLLPSLIVTAPEFSNGDDVEDSCASESVTNSSGDKPRQALSIDDALAFALAGFVSSTSIQPPKYTQTLAVKAPEFSNEEDENDDKKASPSVQSEIAREHSVSCYKTDGTECSEDSTSSNTLDGEGHVMRSLDDDHSEKTAEGADGDCRHCDGGEGACQATGIDTIVEHDVTRTDSNQILDENVNEEVSNESSNILVPNNTDTSDQTENISDTTQEEAFARSESAAVSENTKSGSEILQKVLEFSCASSVVDFEIPVLDVKFASQENSNTRAPLEALLGDVQESNVEPPCIKDTYDDSPIGKQCNLILVDDGEPSATAVDGHLSLDMNYCNLMDTPLIEESESLLDYQDFLTCRSHEIFASSLI
ncbi:hypothetical protein SLA2020_279190 [Shorea laevis]